MKPRRKTRTRRSLELHLLLALIICLLANVTNGQEVANPDLRSLINTLQSGDSQNRIIAARALGSRDLQGPDAEEASRALVQAYDYETGVREEAYNSLRKRGQAAIPALIGLLKSTDYYKRNWAGSILRDIGSPAVPALIETIKNERSFIRTHAIYTLNEIGPVPDEAISPLGAVLRDGSEDIRTRFWAAVALGRVKQEAKAAVPLLIQGLSVEPDLCVKAASSLGELGSEAADAVSELINALKRQEKDVRKAVAEALGKIGLSSNQVIEALVLALKEEEEFCQEKSKTADSYSAEDNPRRIDFGDNLIARQWIDSIEVRRAIARALIRLKAEAKYFVPTLIDLIAQRPITYRYREPSLYYEEVTVPFDVAPLVAEDFKGAVAAVPDLIQLLRDDKKIAIHREVIVALGNIGPEAKEAIPILVSFLQDDKPLSAGQEYVLERLRGASVRALGEIGSAQPEIVIPVLLRVLNSRKFGLHTEAANSLLVIARNLVDVHDTDHIYLLVEARESLLQSDEPGVKEITADVGRYIELLNNRWWQDVITRIKKFWPILLIIAIFSILLLAWLVILRSRPIWLFQINEALLDAADIKLPSWLGGITIPLRYISLVGFFHYHPQVIDAWVAKYIDCVRAGFNKKATVVERETHIPVPVVLDKQSIANLHARDLRSVFSRKLVYVSICGEGGSGKTSLACLLAKWAMSEDTGDRLCDHLMLPVLIEPDVGLQPKDGDDALLNMLQDQVRILTDQVDHPPPALLKHLLKSRRLLVIVDGLSEMKDASRASILASITGLPVNASVITSRSYDNLSDLPKSHIEPSKIKGKYLSDFLSTYLTYRKMRDRFEDEEFFEACRGLSRISKDREITPLFAKLYAEQMINLKTGLVSEDLPDNIPDLMLSYLNDLNRAAGDSDPDDRTVHRTAQIIAWECLKKDFHPASVSSEDVLTILGEEKGSLLIKYLENKLKIIRTVGPGRYRIRFTIDPLSEYLASLHLVYQYRDNEKLWREFLLRTAGLMKTSETIEGFLLSLRDCCLTKGVEVNVPGFVSEELAKQLGLKTEGLDRVKVEVKVEEPTPDTSTVYSV